MLFAPSAQFGWTSLILACSNDHFKVVHALLAAGANKEVKSDVGCVGEGCEWSCEGMELKGIGLVHWSECPWSE